MHTYFKCTEISVVKVKTDPSATDASTPHISPRHSIPSLFIIIVMVIKYEPVKHLNPNTVRSASIYLIQQLMFLFLPSWQNAMGRCLACTSEEDQRSS